MYKYASIHKFLPFDKKNLVGAELLIKSKKYNLKISQYPIKVNKRKDDSRFGKNLIGELKIFSAFVRIILNFRKL